MAAALTGPGAVVTRPRMRPAAPVLVRWLARGTPRNPGADLSKLPVGLDPRGIRVAEGVRAALACASILIANEWLAQPLLIYAALAAFLTCFCDTGGPIRQRAPLLLAFTVLGATAWGAFGLLRGAGLAVALPLAGLGLFCTSFARVWGVGQTAVGNVLSVVIILALDRALAPGAAALIAAAFAAGGLWATALTVLIWRIYPYQPARLAVSEAWRRLAMLSGDLLELVRRPAVSEAEWDAHGRAHRRAVREELEYARTIVVDLVGMRGRLSLRGAQMLLRLETADQVFGTLIALGDLLEDAPAEQRRAAAMVLRLLRPALLVLGRAMVTDRPLRPGQIERVAAAMLAAATDPALHRITGALTDRLRVGAKLAGPGGHLPGLPLPGDTAPAWWDRVQGPVRANLAWHSAMLRHSLRTVTVTLPALAATLIWGGPFAHWLPITVVVTLQPFYATTWQRTLERVGGTVLGGFAGAALAFAAGTPMVLAGLLFPLCVVAFAVRQVSFAAYIACITPIVVVLIELVEPGHSVWAVAGQRALFALAGGVTAVGGWLLLWPSWEPDRLRREQRAALAAHARFAAAVMDELAGQGGIAATEAARRGAGLATNNLEASLGRALQEPNRSQRPRLEAAMVVDATLRRIAGRLSALRHDPASRPADPGALQRLRDWIVAALMALADGAGPPATRPEPPGESFARIVRQIDLLDGAVRRSGE